MSEDLHVDGEITIDPPIPWTAVVCPVDWLDLPASHSRRLVTGDRRDALAHVTETETDTTEGTLIVRTLTAIVAGRFPGIDLLQHVQEIIDRIPSECTFTGHLDCVWAHGEDIWRIVVQGRTAIEIRPVWPDEADRYVLAHAADGQAILLGPHGQVLVTADSAGLAEPDWQRLYRRAPAAGGS